MTQNTPGFIEGDLVSIPLPSGRFAIARIIHLSKRYKDAVGIIAYGTAIQLAENLQLPTRAHCNVGLYYTNVKVLSHYGWRVLRRDPLTKDDRELSRRIVGGAVWVGDDYIGPARAADYKRLPEMSLYGMPALFTELDASLRPVL